MSLLTEDSSGVSSALLLIYTNKYFNPPHLQPFIITLINVREDFSTEDELEFICMDDIHLFHTFFSLSCKRRV